MVKRNSHENSFNSLATAIEKMVDTQINNAKVFSAMNDIAKKDAVSLKEYVEERITAIEKALQARIDSVDRATILAAQQMEKRLEGMNEFRDSLRDQNTTFLPRNEFDSQIKLIERTYSDRLSSLELSRAELRGKTNQGSVNIALMISIAAMIIGSIGIALRAFKV